MAQFLKCSRITESGPILSHFYKKKGIIPYQGVNLKNF